MIEAKILKRSRNQKWIAGVCGGIGTTFNIDPTIVRLVFIFAMIASGLLPLAVTYFIAWLIVPYPTGPSIFRSLVSRAEPGIPVGEHQRRAAHPSKAKPSEG